MGIRITELFNNDVTFGETLTGKEIIMCDPDPLTTPVTSKGITLTQAIAYIFSNIPTYTVATLPTGNSRALLHVSDEVGGETLAYYYNGEWRRIHDNAIVS